MAQRFLSPLQAIALFLVLATIAFFASVDIWQPVDASSPIMYLIPADRDLLETKFTPESLNRAEVFHVGFSSSWSTILEQATNEGLDALIIHHAAVGQVNPAELRALGDQGVVVTGIGIPGDELAALLKRPELYSSPMGGYSTKINFFTYSYAPGSVSSTTDSIADANGVKRMLRVVGEHIAEQRME